MDSIDIERSFLGEYYCSECTGKDRIFYKTVEELYCEHNFELFLKWSNEKIISKNYICLEGESEGFMEGRIFTPDRLEKWKKKSTKYLVAVFLLEEFKF